MTNSVLYKASVDSFGHIIAFTFGGEMSHSDLQHVGVLGMHWGIRRRGPAAPEHTRAKELKKKHVSELTNDELKTAITRLSLEKQFKDISSASSSRGSSILKGILFKVGAQAVNNYVASKNPDGSSYQFFADAVRAKAGTKKS